MCVFMKLVILNIQRIKGKKGTVRGGHTNLGVPEKYGNRIRKGKREREKGIG